MEMMEAVEENTQAKNPMEGDQLVSKGGDDPEANPLHPQEVDVAGHRILKPTVKVPSPPLFVATTTSPSSFLTFLLSSFLPHNILLYYIIFLFSTSCPYVCCGVMYFRVCRCRCVLCVCCATVAGDGVRDTHATREEAGAGTHQRRGVAPHSRHQDPGLWFVLFVFFFFFRFF